MVGIAGRFAPRLPLLLLGVFPGRAEAAGIEVNDGSDVLHASGCALTGLGVCTLRDAITFANAYPGPDVIRAASTPIGTIRPTSPLPPIVDSVSIVGNPFPGLPITIVGTDAGREANGLVLQASNCGVFGVRIESFAGSGIKVSGSGNVLGRASTGNGNTILDNGRHGIEIVGGSDNVVEASTIAGNHAAGVYLGESASGNRVGGESSPGFPNRFYPRNYVLQNGRAGIQIGKDKGDAETSRNRADFNFFSGNGGLPIDLGGDGLTTNDAGDADTGPNDLQNAPTIAITWEGTEYRVAGNLQSTPDLDFQAFVHGSLTNDPVATASGRTDSNGQGPFSFPLSAASECSTLVVAVRTASGTSEFSPPVIAASPPVPPPVAPLFHAIDPCRLVDTRGSGAPVGGPALGSSYPRQLDLDQGCGIPSSAKVLSANVTVTEATGAGFVNFGVGRCPALETSTINFSAGQTRANNAILNLGPDGIVTATARLVDGGTVELIVDVNGYFE